MYKLYQRKYDWDCGLSFFIHIAVTFFRKTHQHSNTHCVVVVFCKSLNIWLRLIWMRYKNEIWVWFCAHYSNFYDIFWYLFRKFVYTDHLSYGRCFHYSRKSVPYIPTLPTVWTIHRLISVWSCCDESFVCKHSKQSCHLVIIYLDIRFNVRRSLISFSTLCVSFIFIDTMTYLIYRMLIFKSTTTLCWVKSTEIFGTNSYRANRSVDYETKGETI